MNLLNLLNDYYGTEAETLGELFTDLAEDGKELPDHIKGALIFLSRQKEREEA